MSEDKIQEYVQQGIFEADDFARNETVDKMAKAGAAEHIINIRAFDAADDRIVLANLVQRMTAKVWDAFFEINEDSWGGDQDAPNQRNNEDKQHHDYTHHLHHQSSWEAEDSQASLEIATRRMQECDEFTWNLEDEEFEDSFFSPSHSILSTTHLALMPVFLREGGWLWVSTLTLISEKP